MSMSGRARRAPGPLPASRACSWPGTNCGGPADGVEGAMILVALSAAFLTVIVLAGVLAGHLYPVRALGRGRVAAGAGRAVRARPGGGGLLGAVGPGAGAGGVAAGGRSRTLRCARRRRRYQAIDDAGAGATAATVSLKFAASRSLRRPAQDVMVANALGAGAVLAGGRGAARGLLRAVPPGPGRQRLARWGQAWAATGPRWDQPPAPMHRARAAARGRRA